MTDPYSEPSSQAGLNQFEGGAEPDWSQHKTYLIFLHLSSFSFFVLSILWYIVPFTMWLIKKDEHQVIDRQGKEVLNFQLSILLGYFSCGLLGLGGFFIFGGFFILGPLGFFTAMICGLVASGLLIFSLIMNVVAAIKVSDGVEYEYPFSIRIIS